MGTLKVGDSVKMKNGETAKVLAELGSGGQGTVYKVSYNGKEYALKWYHKGAFKGNEKAFYNNLEDNIEKGAPTKDFLWPLGITDVYGGVFGYIMEMRPAGFHELTEFFVGTKKQKQVHFKSFSALTNAAVNIIQGFRSLHNNGYSYQDINDGNFFIDPSNGNVLICDNDNVSPFGTNLGILGKQRYMAPEVVTGDKDPDTETDRFSLAVILFRLLYINHPLEGRYSTPPCMTKELEKRYYGEKPIFVYDPNDDRNRPVPGTDNNLRKFWPVYPEYIRDLFVKAFSHDLMMGKKPRIIERVWIDAFMKMKGSIIQCPKCGEETFLIGQGANKCIECNTMIPAPNALSFSMVTLPLYPGVKIMLYHADPSQNDVYTQIGEVVANPSDRNLFGIRNVSKMSWKIILPSGGQRALVPGSVVPIKKDFIIECTMNQKDAGKIL